MLWKIYKINEGKDQDEKSEQHVTEEENLSQMWNANLGSILDRSVQHGANLQFINKLEVR